ncbi:MAG: phage integrase SAM-like domain-containing protein, partial [Prevotella sp.]|nr:phage integrase SAM-like domain-containing protein [Prevotella sp.]
MNSIVTGGTKEVQRVKRIAEAKSRKYVIQFYEYFFAGISDGSISHGNNSEYSTGSVQVWKTFGRYLHEYCAGNVTFDDIDKPFADRFTQFLQKKGFMSNTINKNVTCFRKLCNLAAMEGYNKNAVSLRVWKDRTIKEIDKRAEIYLTDEEIDAMYDMELTGENEIVRDIFL